MPNLYAMPGKEPVVSLEDGTVRVLGHDRASELLTMLEFHGRLSLPDLQYFCGALLHNRYVDQPLAPQELASLVDLAVVPVGELPTRSVIKMMRVDHARKLINNGAIRLGSIDYYRKYDDKELGDPTEGLCVLASWDGKKTVVTKVRGGLNNWLFCTFEGDVDPAIVSRMGYDAAVEITDVAAFSKAIARHLSSYAANYSACKYVRDRALYGEVPGPLVSQDFIDGRISEILGEARAFLKLKSFAHQSEFRFTWKVASRKAEYLDIICPDIVSFCRLISK